MFQGCFRGVSGATSRRIEKKKKLFCLFVCLFVCSFFLKIMAEGNDFQLLETMYYDHTTQGWWHIPFTRGSTDENLPPLRDQVS